MPRLQAKSFTNPDDAQTTPNVRFDTVNLDETTVGYCHFEPGWRWTTEFGSQLGLASCPIRHLGYSILMEGDPDEDRRDERAGR
jgi:hypothetical protein